VTKKGEMNDFLCETEVLVKKRVIICYIYQIVIGLYYIRFQTVETGRRQTKDGRRFRKKVIIYFRRKNGKFFL